MAADTLSTGFTHYGNTVRGLASDPLGPRLVDAVPGGNDSLGNQTTPSILTFQQNANVACIQGIAEDGTNWYEINTGNISISDFTTGNISVTNSSPFTSLPAGVDHLGDGTLVSGNLHVPAVDWDGGNQTSASQTIAIYDGGNLALLDQIDVSGSGNCNLSCLCIGHTGNYFAASYYTGAGPDDRLVDIYEFNISTGAEVAVHTINGNVAGIQAIGYDANHGLYVLTSDNGGDNQIVTLNESFEILARWNPTGIDSTDEPEGLAYASTDDGRWYINFLGSGGGPLPVRRFYPRGMYVHPTVGNGVQFLDNADIPDEGSIAIRCTPGALFNFNTVFDNGTYANDWECWIYSDGRFAARINNSNTAVTSAGAVTAGTEYVLGFSWIKSGSTVNYEVYVNGTVGATAVTGATWVTPPAAGLALGGINAGNNLANIQYRDVIVYNKRLSAGEWSALAGGFDAVYTTPSITSISGDNVVDDAETSVAVVGTNLGNASSTVTICATDDIDDANAITPTVGSGNDLLLTLSSVDLAGSGITAGSTGYLFVENPDGLVNASGFAFTRTGAPDTTPPVLTDNLAVASPTTTGGNLTVTTDEGNGTLFWVVTADGETPNAAEIQAGQTQGGGAAADSGNITVSGTGSQALGTASGLTESTVYDIHAVHVDAASNVSNVVRGTFTTATAPDETAPTLSLPAALLVTQNSVVPVVTTDEANGTLYVVLVPDGDAPSVAQIKAGQQSDGSPALASASQAVSSTGVQFFAALGGLEAETAHEEWFAHTDAAGNDSDAVTVGFITKAAASAAAGVTRPVTAGGLSAGVTPGGVV